MYKRYSTFPLSDVDDVIKGGSGITGNGVVLVGAEITATMAGVMSNFTVPVEELGMQQFEIDEPVISNPYSVENLATPINVENSLNNERGFNGVGFIQDLYNKSAIAGQLVDDLEQEYQTLVDEITDILGSDYTLGEIPEYNITERFIEIQDSIVQNENDIEYLKASLSEVLNSYSGLQNKLDNSLITFTGPFGEILATYSPVSGSGITVPVGSGEGGGNAKLSFVGTTTATYTPSGIDKRIVAGNNVTFQINENTITINATGGSGSGVSSFNNKTGDILLSSGDAAIDISYNQDNENEIQIGLDETAFNSLYIEGLEYSPLSSIVSSVNVVPGQGINFEITNNQVAIESTVSYQGVNFIDVTGNSIDINYESLSETLAEDQTFISNLAPNLISEDSLNALTSDEQGLVYAPIPRFKIATGVEQLADGSIAEVGTLLLTFDNTVAGFSP